MQTFIDNLKLKLLLHLMATMVRRAARRDARVRRLLARERLVLQIQTLAGSGGHFVVEHGAMSLRSGLHPTPDFTQVWRDGDIAMRVLASGNETNLLRAFEAGRVRMRGRFIVGLWFAELTKLARPAVAEPNRA